MTHEQLTEQGWIQTDGSDETLQYANQISASTWIYRQWVDFPRDISRYDQFDKLVMWDSDNWVEDEIHLADYSEEEIADALSTYGYKLYYYCLQTDGEVFITIEDDGYIYPVHDSIQLACECIFELTN